jgi:hypothetical protein
VISENLCLPDGSQCGLLPWAENPLSDVVREGVKAHAREAIAPALDGKSLLLALSRNPNRAAECPLSGVDIVTPERTFTRSARGYGATQAGNLRNTFAHPRTAIF